MTTHPTHRHPGDPVTERTSPVTDLRPPVTGSAELVVPAERAPMVVDGTVLDTRPARTWRDHARLAWAVFGALVAVAATVGAGWLLVTAVLDLIATIGALITWVHQHWPLSALAAAALLALLLSGRAGGSTCGGLHCGGCRGGGR